MIRLLPRSTRSYTLFPSPTLFRSHRRGGIGRQGDEVVENPRPLRRVALEAADAVVGLVTEFGAVIIDAHQPGAIIGADVLAVLHPRIIHLLTEVQRPVERSEEHTSELQSLMRISYAVFCLKKQKSKHKNTQ